MNKILIKQKRFLSRTSHKGEAQVKIATGIKLRKKGQQQAKKYV